LVVLYGTNKKFNDEFLAFAKSNDDINFLHVTSAEIIAEEGATDGSARVYLKDGTSIDFPADTENIIDRITDVAYPKFVEFSQSQYTRLSSTKELIVFGFAPYEDKETLNKLFTLLTDASNAHKNVGFMYGDSKTFARGLSGAGASLNFLPTVVAISQNTQLVWDEQIPLTSESLSQWISDIFDGKAASNRKSEPVPDNNNGPVVKLVYKNYNQYLSSGKPIFVKYYAPWCGHCKNMASDWIKLGETVSKDQVTIADYDATANYAEVEQIEGFPTLVFYDGKGGKVVYQGDRSFDDLLRFVNSQLHTHQSHDEL
jgi:protein disulfide-isomerase A1